MLLAKQIIVLLLVGFVNGQLDAWLPYFHAPLWLQEQLPRVTFSLFWFIAASVVTHLVHRLFDSWEKRRATATLPKLPKLLKDLAAITVWIGFGFVILSSVFGVDVTALLTASGVMIAVIGFALRSMISDVFTGIALGVERPYQIGDWIQVEEHEPGKVVEMNWRSTKIETEAQVVVVFSTSTLATTPFQNFSRPQQYFRDHFNITLDSSITVYQAERIFLSAIS